MNNSVNSSNIFRKFKWALFCKNGTSFIETVFILINCTTNSNVGQTNNQAKQDKMTFIALNNDKCNSE